MKRGVLVALSDTLMYPIPNTRYDCLFCNYVLICDMESPIKVEVPVMSAFLFKAVTALEALAIKSAQWDWKS